MFWIWLTVVQAEVPKVIPDAHVRGKELYDDLCFQCHGANGLADNPMAQSTRAPALAGKIQSEDFPEAISLIQSGKGLMPAYEMVVDKHDTKRILIYLSRLDPETGLDPNLKESSEKSEKVPSSSDTDKRSTGSKEKKPQKVQQDEAR